MRSSLLILGFFLVFAAGGIFGLASLESRQALQQSLAARSLVDSAQGDPVAAYQRWRELSLQARERALIYEDLISSAHLEDGMVVQREADGRAAGRCDSLLFSSLRYTALVKLGWTDKASEAWRGIAGSYRDGRWLRHPLCPHQDTSRDQIFGLVTALSRKPHLHSAAVDSLLRIVERTDGAIDPGPFYVSRLSPSLSELIKQLSLENGWKLKNLPAEIKIGFSTLEFDTWSASPGYTSHLSALVLWNEIELFRQQRSIRSLAGLIDGISAGVWPLQLEQQRLQWSGQKLAELDPKNLFFVWLKYSSAGALSYRVRAELLEKLLGDPAFPATRLPRDCDRRADYLWQRASREYRAEPKTPCSHEFSGVDFLWMAALLTDESDEPAMSPALRLP